MEAMTSTPLKGPAKRTRTPLPAKLAAADAVVTAKKAVPRKPKPAKLAPSPEVLTSMISTAAYYRAANRGFTPGHELDDWLEAERQILASHL